MNSLILWRWEKLIVHWDTGDTSEYLSFYPLLQCHPQTFFAQMLYRSKYISAYRDIKGSMLIRKTVRKHILENTGIYL